MSPLCKSAEPSSCTMAYRCCSTAVLQLKFANLGQNEYNHCERWHEIKCLGCLRCSSSESLIETSLGSTAKGMYPFQFRFSLGRWLASTTFFSLARKIQFQHLSASWSAWWAEILQISRFEEPGSRGRLRVGVDSLRQIIQRVTYMHYLYCIYCILF